MSDSLKNLLDPQKNVSPAPRQPKRPARDGEEVKMPEKQSTYYAETARAKAGPRGLLGGPAANMADGQRVIVWARWVLIVLAVVVAFVNPGSLTELQVISIMVLLLAVANFFLHAQLLRKRPFADPVVYATSLFDLALITVIVFLQGTGGNAVVDSDVFVFYFPALFALAMGARTSITVLYTLAVVAVYWVLCMPSTLAKPAPFEPMFIRSVMLIAVATVGNVYLRIEASRREELQRQHDLLLAQIGEARLSAEPALTDDSLKLKGA